MLGRHGPPVQRHARAVLHHLGEEGYLRLAGRSWDAGRRLESGVRGTPGPAVRGDPDATLVARGAADPEALDIFAVADELGARGWYPDRQTPPDSLHATVMAGHAESVDELVVDLAQAVATVGGGPNRRPVDHLRHPGVARPSP